MRRKRLRDVDPWKGYFRRFQEQYCGSKRFEVRSYGLCQWSKIVFLRGGGEFYKLTRHVGVEEDETVERTEYFHRRIVRRYLGPQNCFLEFCDFLQDCEIFPSEERFLQAAQALGLDAETAQKYGAFYRRCFCK